MYFENRSAYGNFSNKRISQLNRKKKNIKMTVPKMLPYKNIFIQKTEMLINIPESSIVNNRYVKPKHPINIVMINCAMPPAMESVIAFIRLPSFTKSILPPYSPIRLGVFNERVTPHKTDLKAVKKRIGCMAFMSNCHFPASRPQLTKTRMITVQNFQACVPKGIAFIRATELSISG